MKKILLGIFGLMLLLPLGVYAEVGDINSVEDGSNSANQTITIGTVETPVYEVDISWNNPIFDYVYSELTGKYEWKVPYCTGTITDEAEYLFNQGTTLYTDSNCSVEAETYDADYEQTEGYYYIGRKGMYGINIFDMSENGRIVPSVKWTSDEKYSYVEGEFIYEEYTPVCKVLDETRFGDIAESNSFIYTDASCSTHLNDIRVEYEENKYYANFIERINTNLTTDEVPDSGRQTPMGSQFYEEDLTNRNWYSISLALRNNTEPTTTPKAGDTLGTITISIRAAE